MNSPALCRNSGEVHLGQLGGGALDLVPVLIDQALGLGRELAHADVEVGVRERGFERSAEFLQAASRSVAGLMFQAECCDRLKRAAEWLGGVAALNKNA